MSIKINTRNPYSSVVTINHALREIGKTFGQGARQLDTMRAQLDLVLGEGATRVNSKGQIRLRNTRKVREALSDAERASALNNLPTAGEYLEEAKERTRDDRGDDEVTTAEAVEHERKVDRVKASSERIKQVLSDRKDNGEQIPSSMGYDELYELIKDDFNEVNDEWKQYGYLGGGKEFSLDDGDWVTVSDDFFNGGTESIERI